MRQQDLHILQLPAFLPVIDQQDPRLAVGGVALDDFLQLLLRRFQFFGAVQGGGEVVAIILVVRLKLHRFGQTEQGVFALIVVQQPKAQGMLQISRVRLCLELLAQQLAGGIGLALAIEDIDLHHQRLQIAGIHAQGILKRDLCLLEFGVV
ncbi:hypothetical protein D3C81_1643290 [compost metagenome]